MKKKNSALFLNFILSVLIDSILLLKSLMPTCKINKPPPQLVTLDPLYLLVLLSTKSSSAIIIDQRACIRPNVRA